VNWRCCGAWRPICLVSRNWKPLCWLATRLWRIEDLIREKEAAGDFGPGFVALARAVYRESDERGRVKQAINRVLASAMVEEKQYSAY
jgi:hypothetical protein